MNRIDKKLNDKGKLLSIYFTAGYPSLNDTQDIIIKLEESGVDMIEIGLPFSDPLMSYLSDQNDAVSSDTSRSKSPLTAGPKKTGCNRVISSVMAARGTSENSPRYFTYSICVRPSRSKGW